MADKEVSDLTAAGTLDTGADMHVVVSGNSRRTNTAALLTLVGAQGYLSDTGFALSNASVFQSVDADLTAVAALASTGIAVRTAANTWAQRSVAASGNGVSVANGDGVSGNPTVSVADVAGDAGSGGTRGLVPAPAAGDAAAGKYLKADGTWDAPAAGAPEFYGNSISQNDFTTSLADITGLSFSISANETVYFMGSLSFASIDDADWQIAVNGPSTPTSVSFSASSVFGATSMSSGSGVATAFDTSFQIDDSSGADAGVVTFSGKIVNGSNAGTIAMRAKRTGGNTTSLTVRAGAAMLVWRA